MPLPIPEFLVTRLDRPVAVFGAGVSGEGARALLAKLGASTVAYDQKGLAFTGEAALGHGLVVFSPGFPLLHPWLEVARKAGCLCLPEIDFASLFWHGRLVAVTGTNGKTTLTEFLAHALASIGRRARGTGNIGHAFSLLAAEEDGGAPDFFAICEVSSFQAEQLGHFGPDSLIWTNFAEDHLERHRGLGAYFDAKWELVLHTPKGRFLAGTSVAHYAAGFGRAMPADACVETEGLPGDERLAGTAFAAYPQRENFVLALAWWRAEGLDPEALLAAARSFRMGRHRLAKVAEIEGVTYWNDSKATNFHAVEAALAGFEKPVVLIAGGRSKGGDLAGFARRIAPKLAYAVLIGETGPALGAALSSFGAPCSVVGDFEDAVLAASHAARPGGIVLLSPGFASFDMFSSYEDRGNRFEKAVAELTAARV